MRILIADDHDVIRSGLKQLLATHLGWEVCGEAKTGNEAVALATQLEPQVIIMDVGMPELNGVDATRKISRLLPRIKIIVLTMHFSDQLIAEIIDAGACGYILKTDADRELVRAIQAVEKGSSYFTSAAANTLLGPHSKPSPASLKRRLTPREREIVQLLAEGKSSKEAASALGVSVKTADTHRANVMRKLELHSVAALVRYAIKNRIAEA
jgi:DNA-binding NarL/FixJ family response regulator